ncbi:hypothetical protein B0H19DRAFT_1258043 [Mycena capillaripes]|nr:hypothetical protein B0H19DRAFT_1258043 [Mycena capillaripes]
MLAENGEESFWLHRRTETSSSPPGHCTSTPLQLYVGFCTKIAAVVTSRRVRILVVVVLKRERLPTSPRPRCHRTTQACMMEAPCGVRRLAPSPAHAPLRRPQTQRRISSSSTRITKSKVALRVLGAKLDLDGFYAALEGVPACVCAAAVIVFVALLDLASASSSASSAASEASDRLIPRCLARVLHKYKVGAATRVRVGVRVCLPFGLDNNNNSSSSSSKSGNTSPARRRVLRRRITLLPRPHSILTTPIPIPTRHAGNGEGRGPFGWTIPPSPEAKLEGQQEETSNAQYYAALQAHHLHSQSPRRR